ncbi:MAG: sugar transferase, partial [Gammaproteobacteria bacterium]
SRRRRVIAALKAVDLLIGLIAFAVAFWAVHLGAHAAHFGDFLAVRVKVQNVAVFMAFLLLWHVLLSAAGMYKPKRLREAPVRSFTRGVTASSLAVLLLACAAVEFHLEALTPRFLAVFWLTSLSAILASRLLLGAGVRHRRAKAGQAHHALIVGTNPRALQLAEQLSAQPGAGYRIIGFVDDGWTGGQPPADSAYRLVASLDALPAFLRDHVVDEVIVCIPVKSFYDQAEKVISQCEEQGIVVRFPPDLFHPKLARSEIEELDNGAVISFYTGAMDGWQLTLKRGLDIVSASALLVLLSPLLVCVALLIKLTSPGPVLFAQERVGYCKRHFRMYKFRSMVADAEQLLAQLENAQTMDGPAFKMAGDPRITAVGHVIRKTSIDELPQLLNVLKGDMSLVGPRPTPVREYHGFSEDWHRRRFSVRPGITGLWQISGRSTTSFTRRMELDMQYIDKWSLWLDAEILFKTLPAVLRGEGAV